MLKINVLSEEDKALIHDKTLQLLQKTGIKINSRRILELMAQHGCEVDAQQGTIKFPPDLVLKALEAAPRKFVLGGLDPVRDLRMGEGFSYLSTDGQGCYVCDLETGRRRESTMQDFADSVVLCDNLDYISLYWPIISALDAPSEVRTLRELATAYRYTGKHVQTDVFTPQQVPFFIELLEVVLGDRKKISERNIFSVVCCPVSPLGYDPEMMEAALELTEFHVPINILPMPIAGATAPVSLLGSVLLNNIEVLAALAIFQSYRPGTPLIYGSSSGILDMRTGLFAVGSPEEGLQNAACAEMARFYGLPSFASGLASDAKEPGIQATLEKVVSGIIPWLGGTDILGGAGLVETCQCLYFEQLIIDEELFGYINRIREGIRGGEAYLLDEVIAEIGAGGHYLSHKSTKRLLREGEHYIPKLVNRESYDVWLSSPKKDLRLYAREKAKQIIRESRKEYLAPEQQAEMEKVMQGAEKALCK